MSGKLYLYPLSIRIWHLINAVLIIILILTGISIQYVSTDYGFIPFSTAISVHNICGVLLTFNYIQYFIASIVSRNFRFYIIRQPKFWQRLSKQAHYYLFGIFKGDPHPFHATENEKFNPLQKISYWFVIFIFLPLVIFTGWGLLFPDAVAYVILGISGLHVTAVLHIITGFLLSVFLVVHIYLCTVGMKWSDAIKTISTGYHHPLPEEE
jgi:thiosulfate reductase cytochrome b subunit